MRLSKQNKTLAGKTPANDLERIMPMRRILGTASALALSALPAAAQNVIDLDAITIFAGLDDISTLQTGVSVEIVDSEQLQLSGGNRVQDVLARQPGVTLRSQGPAGSQTGFSIRGVSQNNIGVRINGIDVRDPAGPQVAYDFGRLMTPDVGRIEILKGAQSAVFGGQAFGGIVDISTPRATTEGVEQNLLVEGGSNDSASLAYNYAALSGDTELAFSFGHTETKGFSSANENDGNDEDDGFTSTRVGFFLQSTLQNGITLGATGFAARSRAEYDPRFYADPTRSFSIPLGDGESPDEEQKTRELGLRVFGLFDTGTLEHELSVSRYRINRRNFEQETFLTFDPATFAVNGSYLGTTELDYTGTRTTLNYIGRTDLSSSARLLFGADTVHEEYEQTGTYGDLNDDVRTNALFGELRYAVSPEADVNLNLRYEDHSEFGGNWAAQVNGVWRPIDGMALRASLASGYRTPSIYELYGPFGNSELNVERSRSFDLGVEKTYDNGAYVKLTGFWIEAEDIIDYSFSAGTYTQADGTLTRKGLELAAGLPVTDRAFVDLAYTRTESDSDATLDSNGWLSVSPEHSLAATLRADVSDRMNIAVSALSEWDRSNELDDYMVVNSVVSYDLTDDTEVYLRIENMFDEEYETVPGYGQSDRAAYFGIRASF